MIRLMISVDNPRRYHSIWLLLDTNKCCYKLPVITACL